MEEEKVKYSEEFLTALKRLKKDYPKDLNRWYTCDWWGTCDMTGNPSTYYLTLTSTFKKVGKEPMVCLRANSTDPEKLANLLEMYLNTCEP